MAGTTPALDAAGTEALDTLARARADRRPCPPVRTILPPGDVDAAYAVQSAWVAGQLAAGDRLIGRKIGLTNAAVQAQFGVDQPDFGMLLASMDCPQGAPVDTGRLLQPRIEAEIAFILARDLDAPDIGPTTCSRRPARSPPRWRSWTAGSPLGHLHRGYRRGQRVGRTVHAWRRSDGHPAGLTWPTARCCCGAALKKYPRGTGAASLGHPAIAVAWLANTARSYGRPLRSGEIVLSGSLGPIVPVVPGDEFTAEIGGLGTVTAVFA